MQPPGLTDRHALFLDFDGTLVEIADRPDAIEIPRNLPVVLEQTRRFLGGALAVVSGRMLTEIVDWIGLDALALSGSHGAERRYADGRLMTPGDAARISAGAISKALAAIAGDHEGLILETKPWSVSLHYRNAPQLQALCERAMSEAVRTHPGWTVMHGKMVLEARMSGISKAAAVEGFMKEPPFAGRLPVFIGDDRTDEDGMRAAAALGGFGVKVGDGETDARYRLKNPRAVLDYLNNMQV